MEKKGERERRERLESINQSEKESNEAEEENRHQKICDKLELFLLIRNDLLCFRKC